MSGATIHERACPRCAIRRTVRIAGSSFCYDCRLQWHDIPHAEFVPRREAPYALTAQERARLLVYRAAIRDGFYSDR